MWKLHCQDDSIKRYGLQKGRALINEISSLVKGGRGSRWHIGGVSYGNQALTSPEFSGNLGLGFPASGTVSNTFKKYIFVKESDREIFHLLVQYPSGPNGYGWAKLKPGIKNQEFHLGLRHEWQMSR